MASSSKSAAPNCAKCGKMVHDKAMIAEGKVWHTYHFQCITCNKVLPAVYASYQGQVYCLECHKKIMEMPCSKCGKPFAEKCFEFSGQRFHPSCLTCATCSVALPDGVFYPVNDQIYCLAHVLPAQKKASSPGKWRKKIIWSFCVSIIFKRLNFLKR